MDDYVVVSPHTKVRELTEDIGLTMLLRDVQFLEPGKPPLKFLGWMLERTDNGFKLMINPQLIEDIVQDSGAGVKDGVIDETPLERAEHSHFRTQVGRLLFLSVLRPDPVGQLAARHASAPTVSDRIALKRLIRFLSVTREMKLELFPKGRLVLSAVADADWPCLAERRSVTGGVVRLAGWSRCESELYAMGSDAVEVLGIHAFLVEQGFSNEPPVVCGDHSSALQLAHRQGTGRLKHVEVRLLAIQSWESTGRLRLQKVLCAENVADVLTKHVSRTTWETLCTVLVLR